MIQNGTFIAFNCRSDMGRVFCPETQNRTRWGLGETSCSVGEVQPKSALQQVLLLPPCGETGGRWQCSSHYEFSFSCYRMLVAANLGRLSHLTASMVARVPSPKAVNNNPFQILSSRLFCSGKYSSNECCNKHQAQ